MWTGTPAPCSCGGSWKGRGLIPGCCGKSHIMFGSSAVGGSSISDCPVYIHVHNVLHVSSI